MKDAVRIGNVPRRRGAIAAMLFPRIQVRFSIALLLTFFPLGLLYPLDYPAGELLTLCCWIWVFPSPIGWLSLALLPLIPGADLGYFVFNLFCLVATLSIAAAASHSNELQWGELIALHKFARLCMATTLAIAALQAVTDPYMWMSIFSNMKLESGRGAGLKNEPSQLASLLAIYLALLVCRIGSADGNVDSRHARSALFREGMLAILLTVAVTRSISVLIVVVCFVPVLFMRRKHISVTVSALFAGAVVVMSFLGDRIGEAFGKSESMTNLITESVGSWRNVPDILILTNLRDFLFIGNPVEVRAKMTACAVQMSPALAWVQNTFSTFSAGGVTIGVLGIACISVAGAAASMKKLRSSLPIRISWLMIYLAAWFILAKWDPSAWIAVGLLPMAHGLNERRLRVSAPVSRKMAVRPGTEAASAG
jgi:hypothetical protein